MFCVLIYRTFSLEFYWNLTVCYIYLYQASATKKPLLRAMVEPVGQGWHWTTIQVQRLLGNSRRRGVRRMESDEAVALGAEIAGEV